MQAKTDRRAYESMIRMANFCAACKLDVACTRAVVMQALHVAECGNHLLVDTVLSAVRNDWEKHTLSATRKGTKTAMAKYAATSSGLVSGVPKTRRRTPAYCL